MGAGLITLADLVKVVVALGGGDAASVAVIVGVREMARVGVMNCVEVAMGLAVETGVTLPFAITVIDGSANARRDTVLSD
jgi:hypothetical protein